MSAYDGTGPEEILSVEHLGVRLGARDVLSDVTFAIRAGEFTGLIGSNGAGKTTLVKAILGLHPLSSGNIQVAGRPRSRRTPVIGYVPQRYLLDADMPLRARDVVGLGVEERGAAEARAGLPAAARGGLVDRAEVGAVEARRPHAFEPRTGAAVPVFPGDGRHGVRASARRGIYRRAKGNRNVRGPRAAR